MNYMLVVASGKTALLIFPGQEHFLSICYFTVAIAFAVTRPRMRVDPCSKWENLDSFGMRDVFRCMVKSSIRLVVMMIVWIWVRVTNKMSLVVIILVLVVVRWLSLCVYCLHVAKNLSKPKKWIEISTQTK